MQSMFVRRDVAMKKQVHHQFLPGMGYLNLGLEPELGRFHVGKKNCAPPADTKDGSFHVMQPPGGAKPVNMKWIAAESAWASLIPQKGNRLAWTVKHLSRAGWEYTGPAPK